KLDSTDRSWFAKTHQNLKNKTIAYLSMEYGIHNSVKIYSGGLGILAGDHLKESSDLGLPLVAVGFLYEEGYFTQELPIDGWQKAHYKGADFQNLPITEVKDPSNQEKDLIISINFNDLIVKVKIWLMNIGSVKLFLMDTNINENPPWDRDLTGRLYGGSEELRLKQEKILGIGAVRLFKKLNITPTMYHLNEGHCGFSSIERIRDLMLEGKSFSESLNIVRKKTLFTTHTPVPAGHDIFPFNLIETYFDQIYIRDIGRENFFSLGSYEFTGKTAGFNMTALGIRTSKYVNAVSKLHGDVSYEMFKPLWEKIEQKYGTDYHPFTYVTNGIHVPSFVGENIQLLLDSLDSNWRENHDDPNYWKSLLDSKNLSDELLWTFHNKSKNEMFRMIRETSRRKIQNGDWDSRKSLLNGVLLDPKALTLGFARR
ncbi:MAG: alpha-glucan family phosphorylase, partial [Candidatus Heimdallarchaeota archaeon]